MNGRLIRRSSTGEWLWRLIALLLIVVLLVSSIPVGAREPEPEMIPIPAVDKLVMGEDIRMLAEFNPKLDSTLNQLLEVQRREGMRGVQAFGEARQMVLEGDRVQVMLITEPEAIPGLAPAVEGLGGEIQGDYQGLLQALVPIDALEPLAARPDVQLIRDPWRAMELEAPEVVSATTEGLAASNASAWHSAGYDGTGVRVAVINGGFADYTTLLGSDLPSSVGTYDWAGGGMGGSEHGTACAEVVHDMAPGATMDLHKVSTMVDLSQAVTQAIADGVDVISMSLGWSLDGPGDGTGYLAGIVNSARAAGIFYATAAGNDAEVNWAGTYADSGTSGYHDWDGGGTWFNFIGEGTSCVVFPAGVSIRGGLHWDDWSAVNQNYDLHLVRWPRSGSTLYVVDSSTYPQDGGGGQTPQEYINYTTTVGDNCYAWVVERVSSTRNVCLRMIAPKMIHFVHFTPGRSLSYPADSPDAITVAAVDVNSPYPLESYSSQGPTFGSGGACSGGATKPDIAAYANVSTVSYGSGAFNGTSAATPHVAGAAALVKERYPGYSVTQLQNYLETEAIDLGASGKDNLYGSGRLYLPDPTLPAPVVNSITPNTGENTGVVTASVSGNNFAPGATCKLARSGQPDITDPTPSVVNPSSMTCDLDLTGAATGTWDVVVTNPDMQSGTLPNGFTVTGPATAPVVASITPDTGENTGVVTAVVSGSNFETGATCKLARSGQPDITDPAPSVLNSSTMVCDLDLTDATTGAWDVVVTNPDMQSGTLPGGFTVTASASAPVVASITPDTGENTGVVTAVVSGSNFETGATCKLARSGQPDITDPAPSVLNSSTMTCELDLTGAVTGAWDVVVTNPDMQSGTLPGGFTVTASASAPVVDSITPDTGENIEVVTAVVLGSNFETGATCKLAKSGQPDITDPAPSVINPSTMVCDLDLTDAATGAWNVVVTNPDMQSGTLPDGFTVTSPGGEDYYVYMPLVMQRWPPVPYTPTLNPISNPGGDGNYTVTWSTALLADTYELQEDSSCAFSSPTVVYSGSGTFKDISGQAPGTYSYRVKARNSWGDGGWSGCQSVSVGGGPERLPPLADATVIQGAPDANFGSTSDMWVGYDHCEPAGKARSLVKFDVSDIPAGTTISEAKLYLYLVNGCDIGERTHQVTTYRITSSWSSSSVTWNNQPGHGEAYGSAWVPSKTWGWYTFDVTSLVQNWVNGTSNYGLMLRSNESSGNDSARLGFATMNVSGTDYDPYIKVTYPGMVAPEEVSLPAHALPQPSTCGATIQDAISGTMGVQSSAFAGYVERGFCASE